MRRGTIASPWRYDATRRTATVHPNVGARLSQKSHQPSRLEGSPISCLLSAALDQRALPIDNIFGF